MAVAPGKNKLKMGSAGRYYGAYLIYDVANSCLAALHAKMPPPVVVTRTNPPSPVHVQNPLGEALYGILNSSTPVSAQTTFKAISITLNIHYPNTSKADVLFKEIAA
ncbi:hypothetical protein G5I_02208 [Acromyrmex echinatior]|uniref:Uncharacterized protein n=1 Tax=Acromyrmex echinatior TaxID=103372 RepID=F4W9Q4_ACREC|nr:hypothetical protein G5I_02208 [Acromyrmex echinatior]